MTINVLIPKTATPTTMRNLRPIALYNVLYKLKEKVLANRLKPLLPNSIVNEAQFAFIPGRSITDNVLIIHHMKQKNKGNVGEVALKIDISKAYDRLCWYNLKVIIMLKMGFAPKWVDWIMLCVSTVTYSNLLMVR